ncbi:hypothetical protein [Microcystis phage Mwe-JY05]
MGRPHTTTAATPNEQFVADVYSVPAPDPGPVDPGEAFAVFAAVPTPRVRAGRGRVDPEDLGERHRDEPADDWQQDRRQDRYDTTIYGSDR